MRQTQRLRKPAEECGEACLRVVHVRRDFFGKRRSSVQSVSNARGLQARWHLSNQSEGFIHREEYNPAESCFKLRLMEGLINQDSACSSRPSSGSISKYSLRFAAQPRDTVMHQKQKEACFPACVVFDWTRGYMVIWNVIVLEDLCGKRALAYIMVQNVRS